MSNKKTILMLLISPLLLIGCAEVEIDNAGVGYRPFSPLYGETSRYTMQQYDSDPDTLYNINLTGGAESGADMAIKKGDNGYYATRDIVETDDMKVDFKFSANGGNKVGGIVVRFPIDFGFGD